MRALLSIGALALIGLGASASAPEPYSLTAAQAQDVATVVRFVQAFNGRQLRASLALFAADAGASDCDYRSGRAVDFRGRDAVARWLRARFADRDQLTIAQIANTNPTQPTGVVAVDYSRRTSRTLRALGFANGIRPQLSTKVILTARPVRIARFANGPVGGSQELCRPQPATP